MGNIYKTDFDQFYQIDYLRFIDANKNDIFDQKVDSILDEKRNAVSLDSEVVKKFMEKHNISNLEGTNLKLLANSSFSNLEELDVNYIKNIDRKIEGKEKEKSSEPNKPHYLTPSDRLFNFGITLDLASIINYIKTGKWR